MMKNIDYFVVIFIFNEEEIIFEFWCRLLDILDRFDSSSEVIFINDGSVDNFLEFFKEINYKN